MTSNMVKNEEDFVHVGEEKMTEASLRKEIEKYKEIHSTLLEDITKLEQKKMEAENLTQKIRERTEKEKKKLLEKESSMYDQDQKYQEGIRSMKEQNQKLKEEECSMKEKISHLQKETEKLEAICTSGVQKKMVFKGGVSNNIPKNGITVKHQIRYPVKGGTALVIFDEPSVAARLIKKKHHQVELEECHIKVTAEAVEFAVLDNLTMDMSRSPRKILVSGLPVGISEETLLDKLELFFHKTKNGGGEVEKREFLADSWSAILTFAKEGVAPQLIEEKTFYVPFGGTESHQVCVSPSLDGDISRYEMKQLLCNRTVLITGIPDIKDEESLKDLLTIHFQKATNGGGEVQELFYCPLGKNTIALFEDEEDGVLQ